jgi:transposase
MAKRSCDGCRKRDALLDALRRRLAELEAEVADLKARLGRNASNSSLPPSANPPAAPPPVVKAPTGRKPGGQPGHPGPVLLRLPPERLTRVVPFVPAACAACHAALPAAPSAADPPPAWHQVAELPPRPVEVTEYQGHARTCPACGAVTRAAIPAGLRAHRFGPRLAAALSYLSGCHHVSRRGVEEVVETVFGLPVALGTIHALEQETSRALAAAHAEAVAAVRRAPVKHVDETGWKEAGRRRWLWLAATARVAAFVVQVGRGLAGLTALLGETIRGVLCSDRWVVYNGVPPERRQLCWAHLKRDFQAMADRGGAGAAVGVNLLALTGLLFAWWYRVRDGTLPRRTLRRRVGWLREDFRAELRAGAACACARTAGTCRDLLAVEEALWTFVRREGVEPTNNHAERLLRPAVLWRKNSFGCHSASGCRFVERLLTVVQTLRLRGRGVLDYLCDAVAAHRAGLPTPKLLAAR